MHWCDFLISLVVINTKSGTIDNLRNMTYQIPAENNPGSTGDMVDR